MHHIQTLRDSVFAGKIPEPTVPLSCSILCVHRHTDRSRNNVRISPNTIGTEPTQAALVQHTKRTVLQGGYVWGQTLLKQAVIPSPSDYGWICDDGLEWLPYWTSLPQLKDTCSELIKCSCKSACRGRCKCSKANLACTGLCKCGGNCN